MSLSILLLRSYSISGMSFFLFSKLLSTIFHRVDIQKIMVLGVKMVFNTKENMIMEIYPVHQR